MLQFSPHHLHLHPLPTRRSSDLRYKLITNVRSSLMAVNIHITIIELNALHTKRQNLFQELDAVIHLLMEEILSFRIGRAVSAGMPRPISYAVFCLKKKTKSRRTMSYISGQ